MRSPSIDAVDRRRAALEVVALGTIVAVDLWWLRILPNVIPAAVAQLFLIAIVIAGYWRRKGRLALPPARIGVRRAWVEVGLATSAVVALLLALGPIVRSETYDEIRLFALHWTLADQMRLVLVALGRASIQQFMLLGFLWPAGLELFGRASHASLFAAVFFAATHLPNGFLVAATFLGGLLWLFLYSRGRRPGAILLSHLVLAGATFALLPERTLRGLHVGAKAVVLAPRYEVYEQSETVRLLGILCSPSDSAAADEPDPVAALFRHILGRDATTEELDKWDYRTERLSRCSAAKKLAMSSQPL